MRSLVLRLTALAIVVAAPACGGSGDDAPPTAGPDLRDIPGHEGADIDGRQKHGARTLAAEAYLRSYMMLFSTDARSATPDEVAALARGADGELFQRWNDYAGALGLPDYTLDIPRAPETNTLMLGTFERLAIALCDRSAELEIDGTRAKHLYDFPRAADPLDRASFDGGFDAMHRTVLGYPAKLAPSGRAQAFYDLYSATVKRHTDGKDVASRLSPAAAGWAAVCEGLVRHPEFQLY